MRSTDRVERSSSAGVPESPAASLLESLMPSQDGVAKAIADLRKEINRGYYLERLRRLLGLRRRTVEVARRKYDKIAGRYQAEERGLSPEDKILAYVGDEVGFISTQVYHDYYRAFLADFISRLGARQILEVGAGELNTILPIAERLGGGLDAAVALDISARRLAAGRIFDREGVVSLCVAANASELPFPDDYFDLVLTSHCLEQSPELVSPALEEFARVSRGHVLLAEPAYELAHRLQRRRIRKIGYARGIPAAAKRLKLHVMSHELLPVREFQNGTAVTLIAVSSEADA